MHIIRSIYSFYEKILLNLFFLFFTSPVLSPAINGLTIYLYWIIPLMDIKFLQNIPNMPYKMKYLYGILGTSILFLINGQYLDLLKIYSIIFSLMYLNYSVKRKMFYLIRWFNFNIYIGILQFISYYLYPLGTIILSPTRISKLIWNEYATVAYGNIFPVFGEVVRVCGLSREAGFFAAFLIVIVIYGYLERISYSRYQWSLFLVSYIISFSKMSLVIIPLYIINRYSRYINKLPFFIGVSLLVFLLVVLVEVFPEYFLKDGSFLARFSGYAAVNYMDYSNMLFGIGSSIPINENAWIFGKYSSEMQYFSDKTLYGYPYIVSSIGYIGLLMWLIFICFIGISLSELLFLLGSTFSVTPISATSFSVLAWWIIFRKNIGRKDFLNKK